ncbi:C10 family peptidase [Phocaeicola faecalis]
MKKLLFLLCLLALNACSSQEDIKMQNEESTLSYTPAYITVPDTCRNVTTQTAENIAHSFFMNQTSTRSTARNIHYIHTFSSENGTPLFYIVNYKDRKGFIIISATKDYTPILAFSETGNFDITHINETGVSVWLKEQKVSIASAEQLPDSIKMKYRAMWTAYNTHQEELIPKEQSRSMEDVYKLIGNSVNQWISEGYIVYRLSEYKNTDEFSNLPQEVQTKLLTLPLGYANPNYGGREEVSFILKKTAETYTYGPLLQTTWGQTNGYNQYTPNQYPAGCVAVAMGQIIKYHQSSSNYNWSAMANNTATSETARLLADIGSAVHMNYGPNGSGSTITEAYNAFKNSYGYSNVKLISHDKEAVMNQIKNNYPVYMRGGDTNGGGGHAWVCDGYQTVINAFDFIKLMTLEDCPIGYEPKMFSNPYTYPSEPLPFTVFHMNWGWEGSYNGYYSGTNPNSYNFSIDRKELIDLYP